MNINKKQLYRLIRFVGELKENRYPNCFSFAKELNNTDIDENINIACSYKTIQRDIKLLKEYFKAPIEYDTEKTGYYLVHHGWNFNVPLFTEEDLMASVFGAKIAEDIIPEPLKSKIRDAVDLQLTVNNPDFLDTATISTFVAASGVKVKIDSNVFARIFQCWMYHKSALISYQGPHEQNETERQIDPYIINYYNSAWYIKAYCHLRNDIRDFAIHRIKSVQMLLKTFDLPADINRIMPKGQPFDFDKINNIEAWCSPEITPYILERQDAYDQTYEMNEDGSLNLHIKSAPWHSIVKWVLSEGGKVKIIKPESLAQDIKKQAEVLFKVH